jgi:hypothetical protein
MATVALAAGGVTATSESVAAVFSGMAWPPRRQWIDRMFQLGHIYIVGGVLGNGFIGANFLPSVSLYNNCAIPGKQDFFDFPGARTT